MGTFEAFCADIDAIDLDPRPRFKSVVQARCEIRLQAVPEEIANEIVAPVLSRALARFRAVIEGESSERFSEIIGGVDSELHRAVLREQQHGRLKPASIESQIAERSAELDRKRWGARELDAFRTFGAQIGKIEFWSIEIDGRKISRDEIRRAIPRPVSFPNEREFEASLPSEGEIARAEQDAASESRVLYAPGNGGIHVGPWGSRQA